MQVSQMKARLFALAFDELLCRVYLAKAQVRVPMTEGAVESDASALMFFDIAGFEGTDNWIAELLIVTIYAIRYVLFVIELFFRAIGHVSSPLELAAGMFPCTELEPSRSLTFALVRGRLIC